MLSYMYKINKERLLEKRYNVVKNINKFYYNCIVTYFDILFYDTVNRDYRKDRMLLR